MKVESGMKIDASLLAHCPWNPRGEITPESVADLTASIKEKGLLQDIGVMARARARTPIWVIYGNRRFVAAQAAGLKKIPCKIYSDLSEQDAREITRIENEVRLGIDPIEDAKLLHSFIKAGRTYEDVALMFGTSPATVCRREKLIDLDASIVEIVKEHPDKLATNALERIAAYPSEIQKKTAAAISNKALYTGGVVAWGDLQSLFYRETNDLDNAKFVKDVDADKLPCATCYERTGAQTNLFGDLEGDEKLGCCLNANCFKRQVEKFRDEQIRRLIPDGCTERVKVVYLPYGEKYVEKWSKTKAPCAYYVAYQDGEVQVKFGPSKAAEEAAEKAQREADEIADANKREFQRQRSEIFGKIRAVVDSEEETDVTFEKMLTDFFAYGKRNGIGYAESFLYLCARLELTFDESEVGQMLKVENVSQNPVAEFIDVFGGQVSETIQAWYGDRFCKKIVNVFDCSSFLTDEEIAFVKDDKEED